MPFTVITVTVIMILTRALPYLYNLLNALYTVTNKYVQVARVKSCANHMQHTAVKLLKAQIRKAGCSPGVDEVPVRSPLAQN